MDYKVLITDGALEDLREIVEFVARDSPVAAKVLGEKLIAGAMRLATMPERFAVHDAHRSIRKMPIPPYLIYFGCDEVRRVVNILHFWHGARLDPEFQE